MSKFQISVIVFFVVALIAGAIAFATYKNDSTSNAYPTVTIWGTFPADVFTQHVSEVNASLSSQISINYVEKNAATFSSDFVRALAVGQGPDAILVEADMILPQQNKLTLIPYSALSQRAFLDSYIQEAQVYLTNDGILALPFTVDPLVMFWNRDVYNAGGFATYPKTWEEFPNVSQKLTVKDQNSNIRKSAIALGTFQNITNSREVLGSLFMQKGNAITVMVEGGAASTLKNNREQTALALDYFSQFADPTNKNYSWNRAQPIDKTAFLSGNLATYFGFASEIKDIRSKNPNLNFDVAPFPQFSKGSNQTAAYAKLYGFSVVRSTPIANPTYQVISIITAEPQLKRLGEVMYLPTVLNSLAQNASDPYIDSFNRAALISRTWLDADPNESRRIFGTMVDSVISGQKRVEEAIDDANAEYDILLQQLVTTNYFSPFVAQAGSARSFSTPTESVNISDSKFSLVVCDGPPMKVKPYPTYRDCDFNAAMRQVQHLVNIMMVIGVLAAIFGFLYAGFLYITGVPANISKAHSIFPKIFWGFILMLTAWFIVYQLIVWLTPESAGFTNLLGK